MIKAESLQYGLTIGGSSDSSRSSTTFYGQDVSDEEFTMGLVFRSMAEYLKFEKWFSAYGKGAVAGSYGPMLVYVPKSKFIRIGIPKSIEQQETIETVAPTITLQFTGARDPLTKPNNNVSKFYLPKSDVTDAPFFYPGGVQLAGDKGVDSLYGSQQETVAPWDGSVPTGPGKKVF